MIFCQIDIRLLSGGVIFKLLMLYLSIKLCLTIFMLTPLFVLLNFSLVLLSSEFQMV